MAYTLMKNATLIDGNGGEPLSDAAVLVQDDKIEAVGQEADMPKIAEDVKIIDAEGGYILPGLIDSHVHMMMQSKDMRKTMAEPFSLKFYNAIQYMRRTLDTGITTVRDAGFTDAGVKEAVERGLVQGPRMQVSINPLTTTGGHGDSWMRSGVDTTSPSYPGMPGGICDGVEEVRKKVREMLRAGADNIKVHATGGVMSPTDHPDFAQFSEEELRVMVEEASFRKDRKVMAHAQGNVGIKNAVRAGVRSIEHGIDLDEEAISMMKERGTYLVLTLLAPVSVLESDEMPDHAIEKSKEVAETHRHSVARAYEAGVNIAMGTDAGVMPHGTNLRELQLMCDIGMSPMEAIVATTKTAAECLRWEDRLGTVESGKLADLIVTKTNPLADIQSLEDETNITYVMKNGGFVKQ